MDSLVGTLGDRGPQWLTALYSNPGSAIDWPVTLGKSLHYSDPQLLLL